MRWPSYGSRTKLGKQRKIGAAVKERDQQMPTRPAQDRIDQLTAERTQLVHERTRPPAAGASGR